MVAINKKVAVDLSLTPGTPTAGWINFYAKSDGLYYKTEAGLEVGPLGGLTIIQNNHGLQADVSLIKSLDIDDPYRVAGTTFVGATIDTNFWTSTVSASGTNVQANSLVTTASGTTNSAYAQFQSFRSGRFIFAHPMSYRAAIRIPTVAVALNTRRWGAFSTTTPPTPTNGFYFELSAAGVLSVNVVNAGSITSVASGSFNGEVASYVLDTNVHAYEINYFVMKVQLLIDDVLIHTFTPTTANLTGLYTLPINCNSVNTAAGVTSGIIETWAAIIRRKGRALTQVTSGRQVGIGTLILKRGAGALHSLNLNTISNNAVVTLYDNTAASGTVLWASGSLGANALPFEVNLSDIQFFTGLTLDITTAAATTVVIYE